MATAKDASRLTSLEQRAVGEAAEGYVEALISQGVACLFLNPGTDTFPIQEALAKLAGQGRPVPRTVLCLFEFVALAAAHGYYAATGRPQAVLVHVDVGTANLGAMLHNAQRGRAAVFIAAGRAPYTIDPNLRGSRDTYIHWLQEQPDQHAIVRNYVKWDYELRRPDQVGEVVARAFQLAASDPPGPVYLTLPREVLMDEVGEVTLYPPARVPSARLGAGDPDALREVARRLVEAKRPVVLTGSTGRTEAGYRGLLRLAELLALPVVEFRDRANFPTDHPLYQGDAPAPWLAAADLVLILDHDVPYIPTRTGPAPDATVIQIDLDPVKERIPLWTFPLSLAIPADTSRALGVLADAVEGLLTDAPRRRIAARREKLAARHARQRAEWEAEARAASTARPIHPAWLASCLGQIAREVPDCIFVDEAVTNDSFLWHLVPLREPGTWFKSGGSGLGWGLGGALGIKLAHPDRPVVALVGDGSFVFGEPLAALWAAQTQAAPILVVIFNNSCYNATKSPLVAAYPDGHSVTTDRFVGIDLLPAPRYDLLAQSVGAHGERVEDPAEVLPALRRGLDRVRAGQSVILDVQLARP
jgi:acetolactate synthase I/II/III large subunit